MHKFISNAFVRFILAAIISVGLMAAVIGLLILLT